MHRSSWWAVLPWLLVAGVLRGQAERKEPEPPAVVALLEDDDPAVVRNLHNDGQHDGSRAAWTPETAFSGTSSLSITHFQRFRSRMPGWRWRIAENPRPGEYRYLRFAWRRTQGPGIKLQIITSTGRRHDFHSGEVSPSI